MKEETLQKYIGVTKGCLTVIELDHETYNKEKQVKRSYFKCKCNRCGRITIVRADRFTRNSTYLPVSCSHCVIDRQKETAENKYQISKTKSYRNKISNIRSNARLRNLDINLSDEEIKEFLDSNCYYCGCEKAFGIDRIDSKKGYTKDNCVPCCKICNIMKNKFDLDLFLDKIIKIYNRFHNKSSTTISKESTSQANGDGSGELLTAAQVKEDDIVYSTQ